MASGIEIAGLVLAVLPLFISAAEHYKDGIGFVRKAVKKELFAAQYKEELTQQKALLSLYIKGVVGRTELTPQTQMVLVNDPLSKESKVPHVVKQISAELAEAYQPFLDTILRLCKALARQIKDETGKSPNDDDLIQQFQDLCVKYDQAASPSSARTKLLEGIKFSWKSSQRAEILAELQACNQMLEKLSNAADRAKPYVRKQQSRRVHAAYEHREVVQRLFEILQNACRCTPSETRQVGLRLQVFSDEIDNTTESKFQMVVLLSQGVICELSARIARAATEEPPKKRVRILSAGSDSCNSTSATPSKNMKLLEDICKEATRAHACKSCLQLVVDKHEKVYCSDMQQSLQSGQQLISLEDMMSKLKLHDRKRWLHKEKSILAVILAYSLLQLHDSPWSQSQWNSSNITFLDNGLFAIAQPNTGDYIQLRRPYTRSQVVTPTFPAAVPIVTQPRRRNAHLHALGVVLLELYLNRSIQDNVTASGTNDYRGVAQDVLEDHADDMSMTPEYLQAIRFCLSPHPNPYSGSFSFDDRGFREVYYQQVISMLEENLTSRFEVSENIWLDRS